MSSYFRTQYARLNRWYQIPKNRQHTLQGAMALNMIVAIGVLGTINYKTGKTLQQHHNSLIFKPGQISSFQSLVPGFRKNTSDSSTSTPAASIREIHTSPLSTSKPIKSVDVHPTSQTQTQTQTHAHATTTSVNSTINECH